MMQGTGWVAAAAIAFVGTHFLLSHPLRRPLVAALGEGTFLGVYSLVAAVTLAALGWSFSATPATAPLWPVGDTLWATPPPSSRINGQQVKQTADPKPGQPVVHPRWPV